MAVETLSKDATPEATDFARQWYVKAEMITFCLKYGHTEFFSDVSPKEGGSPKGRLGSMWEATLRETTTAAGLRKVLKAKSTCGCLGCDLCGMTPKQTNSKMLRCGACKKVWYCGLDCQKLAWKGGHKEVCSKIAGR